MKNGEPVPVSNFYNGRDYGSYGGAQTARSNDINRAFDNMRASQANRELAINPPSYNIDCRTVICIIVTLVVLGGLLASMSKVIGDGLTSDNPVGKGFTIGILILFGCCVLSCIYKCSTKKKSKATDDSQNKLDTQNSDKLDSDESKFAESLSLT